MDALGRYIEDIPREDHIELSELPNDIANNDSWLLVSAIALFNTVLSTETNEKISSLAISLAIFAMWIHGVGQEIAKYKNGSTIE